MHRPEHLGNTSAVSAAGDRVDGSREAEAETWRDERLTTLRRPRPYWREERLKTFSTSSVWEAVADPGRFLWTRRALPS